MSCHGLAATDAADDQVNRLYRAVVIWARVPHFALTCSVERMAVGTLWSCQLLCNCFFLLGTVNQKGCRGTVNLHGHPRYRPGRRGSHQARAPPPSNFTAERAGAAHEYANVSHLFHHLVGCLLEPELRNSSARDRREEAARRRKYVSGHISNQCSTWPAHWSAHRSLTARYAPRPLASGKVEANARAWITNEF